MAGLLMDNLLNILTVGGAGTLVFVLLRWRQLPVLQRMVGLQFFFIYCM